MFVQGQPEIKIGQGQSEIYRQPVDIFSLAHMGCAFVWCSCWATSSSDGLLYLIGIL